MAKRLAPVRVGELKADLRLRGLAKGDADLQIASTTIIEEAVLISDDQALLDGTVPSLKAENWLQRPGHG